MFRAIKHILFLLVFSTSLSLTSISHADGLDAKYIPHDAKWVAHVDVDALQASSFLSNAVTDLMAIPDFKESIPETLQFMQTSTWKDFTSFSRDEEPIVLVSVDADWRQFLSFIEQEPSYTSVHSGEHEIHHWTWTSGRSNDLWSFFGDGETQEATADSENINSVFLCRLADDQYLLTSRLVDMTATLAVVDGKARSLDPKKLTHVWNESHDNPILQYVRLNDTSTDIKEPACLFLVMSGKQKMSLESKWDLADSGLASAAEFYTKGENLVEMIKSMSPKEATEETETNNSRTINVAKNKDEDADPKNGKLSFGVSFKGKDLEENRDEVVEFLNTNLKLDRDGNQIHFHWTSHAEADVDYSTKDGFTDIKVQLNVIDREDVAAEQDETIRRR